MNKNKGIKIARDLVDGELANTLWTDAPTGQLRFGSIESCETCEYWHIWSGDGQGWCHCEETLRETHNEEEGMTTVAGFCCKNWKGKPDRRR